MDRVISMVKVEKGTIRKNERYVKPTPGDKSRLQHAAEKLALRQSRRPSAAEAAPLQSKVKTRLLKSQPSIYRQHLPGNKVRSRGEEHHGCGDVRCRPTAHHRRLFRRLFHE